MSPTGFPRQPRRAAPKKTPSAGRRGLASLASRVIPPKRKKMMSPAFAAAVVGVLVILLVALMLQRTLPLSAPVGLHLPPPDFTSMLPAGSLPSPSGPVEIPDVPQSSYALGYVTGSGASVAYFRWSRNDQSYHLTSSVPLSGGGGHITGVPTLSTLRIGVGASTAVVARGAEGASIDGVYVLAPSGDGLAPLSMISQDQSVGVAHFLSSTSVKHSVDVGFGDVNGDGDQDAVVNVTDTDETGRIAKTTTVYAWTDGKFVYDKDLTWAMTADKRIFPEPAAPSKTQ